MMDDDEMVREVVGEMLIRLGHKVSLASDGKEAIKLFREAAKSDKRFGLLIMDLTIPGGMGGKETIQEILKIDRAAKVIVSSGYCNDPIMANHKDHGISLALAKPFILEDLARAIGQVID